MAFDRRTLLRGWAGLGAAAATGASSPAVATASTGSSLVGQAQNATASPTPVENLRRSRQLLIDGDNLGGPGQVINTVRAEMRTIRGLRQKAAGRDGLNLMELQAQYGEFLSWLHQDLGDPETASLWLDRTMRWSRAIDDGDLTTYVLARKAQLAGETAAPTHAIELAEAAQHMARPRGRLAAVARTFQAYGHALRGEADKSARAIDDARHALDRVDADPTPWGVWFNASYVESYRAQSLEALGKHAQAADAFAEATRLMPNRYVRDRGVCMARQAMSLAGARDPERAATVGLRALRMTEHTRSGRAASALAQLSRDLVPYRHVPEVAVFRAAFGADSRRDERVEA